MVLPILYFYTTLEATVSLTSAPKSFKLIGVLILSAKYKVNRLILVL